MEYVLVNGTQEEKPLEVDTVSTSNGFSSCVPLTKTYSIFIPP